MLENVGAPGVEGAAASMADVVTLAAADCAEVFPAASYAATVKEYEVERESD